MKEIVFMGSSLDDLRAFPLEARQRAGYQLHRIQNDLPPDDWRPMRSVGPGAREFRITLRGAFRVIYVMAHADRLFVLNAFEKKSRKTPTAEIEKARRRLRNINNVR